MNAPPTLRFSVIIPTLNEADELPATLDAAIATLGSSTEIVIADGGSRDGTCDLARGRARVVRSRPGRGRQLNAGARAAQGDLLIFLHADTWLTPGAAEALAAALARPEVVGGCFRLALRGPSSRRPVARVLTAAINLRSRWLRTATGDQAIFVRAATFHELGGFPELELFEDVIFYRRLRRRGRRALLGPAVRTSDRRWRKRGYVRTILLHLRLRLLFLLGVPSDRLARVYRGIR